MLVNFDSICSLVNTILLFNDPLDHMPVQGSTWAGKIDFVNALITWISVLCTVLIVGAMIYFGIKYRRKSDNDQTPYITHSVLLEIIWTAIPTVVVAYLFWYGFVVYKEMRNPPANPLDINLQAYKWGWNFQYPTGKQDGQTLVVPVGQPVRVIMKSQDVNHSFFIPAMRVKEDIIASQYNYLWFNPTKTGEFPIFCTEYCGDNHSKMFAKLKVVSREEYDDYVNDRTDGPALAPEELGKKLFAEKACASCHSLDGSSLVGPTLKGIIGKTREFSDGTSTTADENYLRESILYSSKKLVKGYPNVMPSFDGLLKDEDVTALISYIKTAK